MALIIFMSFERIKNRYSIHALKLVFSDSFINTVDVILDFSIYSINHCKLHILRNLRLSECVF
jgi:hypothetical protein